MRGSQKDQRQGREHGVHCRDRWPACFPLYKPRMTAEITSTAYVQSASTKRYWLILDQPNIEQTLSKRHDACIKHSLYKANIEQTLSWLKQAYWNPAPWLKCRPRLRPHLITCYIGLISVLITIERRASCSMFARSCKHISCLIMVYSFKLIAFSVIQFIKLCSVSVDSFRSFDHVLALWYIRRMPGSMQDCL